jgi:hypothetical protein
MFPKIKIQFFHEYRNPTLPEKMAELGGNFPIFRKFAPIKAFARFANYGNYHLW